MVESVSDSRSSKVKSKEKVEFPIYRVVEMLKRVGGIAYRLALLPVLRRNSSSI